MLTPETVSTVVSVNLPAPSQDQRDDALFRAVDILSNLQSMLLSMEHNLIRDMKYILSAHADAELRFYVEPNGQLCAMVVSAEGSTVGEILAYQHNTLGQRFSQLLAALEAELVMGGYLGADGIPF